MPACVPVCRGPLHCGAMNSSNNPPLFPEPLPSAPEAGPVPRVVHERIVDELETRLREASESAEYWNEALELFETESYAPEELARERLGSLRRQLHEVDARLAVGNLQGTVGASELERVRDLLAPLLREAAAPLLGPRAKR